MDFVQLHPSAWTASDFLSVAQCGRLIALAESAGFDKAGVRVGSGQQSMPNVRNNERVMLDAPDWLALVWSRLSMLALPTVGNKAPAGLPRLLRFYKYGPGERFKMHKDGPWTEGGLSSQLTLLVYLNDGVSGGATKFKDFTVEPKAGMALLFLHDTWHEGAAVEKGVKYVLRSDVLYGAGSTASATHDFT